jgi:transcription initiation factor TFIIIB Brf1 subunit/transcription initiation factor TFIIB
MTKEKIIKKNECPECGSNNVLFNEKKQQIVCRDCGAIFEELMPEEEKQFEKAHKQK